MADPPCIYVLAGTNGAGKSTIAGARFRASGGEYSILTKRPAASSPRIRPLAGTRRTRRHGITAGGCLERAIAGRLTFAFETTLGGDTIAALLDDALDARLAVRVWCVGLDTVERHIARVRRRVARGGHDIPDQKIRERYDRSRLNLIRLLPRLTELRL